MSNSITFVPEPNKQPIKSIFSQKLELSSTNKNLLSFVGIDDNIFYVNSGFNSIETELENPTLRTGIPRIYSFKIGSETFESYFYTHKYDITNNKYRVLIFDITKSDGYVYVLVDGTQDDIKKKLFEKKNLYVGSPSNPPIELDLSVPSTIALTTSVPSTPLKPLSSTSIPLTPVPSTPIKPSIPIPAPVSFAPTTSTTLDSRINTTQTELQNLRKLYDESENKFKTKQQQIDELINSKISNDILLKKYEELQKDVIKLAEDLDKQLKNLQIQKGGRKRFFKKLIKNLEKSK